MSALCTGNVQLFNVLCCNMKKYCLKNCENKRTKKFAWRDVNVPTATLRLQCGSKILSWNIHILQRKIRKTQFFYCYNIDCIYICSACKAKNQDGAPRPTSAWPMSSLRANAVLYYVLYYVYYVLYICTLGHIGLTAVRASALNI